MSDDSDFTVGSFPKNKREEVRVTISKYKGHDLLGIRLWYKTDGDALLPGKSGLSIRVSLLPELLALLKRALSEASARGLVLPSASSKLRSDESIVNEQEIVNLLNPQPKRK